MAKQPPGHFIEIDGGDGAGKTTQIQRLQARLTDYGVETQVVRQPGGDEFAEKMRELLLSDIERTAEAELWGFATQRTEMLARVRDLIAKGTFVLFDRGTLSAVAYQSYGRGIDIDYTRSVYDLAGSGLPKPMIFLLNVPDKVAQARRAQRGMWDHFEKLNRDFHERVNEGYRAEAKFRKAIVIDGAGSESEVEARIWKHIKPLLKF